MTLYFENPVRFPEFGSISVQESWHSSAPFLAVSSFSQDKGGFVTIFDELGEPLPDLNYPVHRSFQATALCWHPERTLLITGWENGDIKIWNGEGRDFRNVTGPHKAPITLLGFSEKGGRLASCDSTGSLVGWKLDSHNQGASLVFHLELRESVTHLTFRLTARTHPEFDIEGLARAAVEGDEHALDMFSNWRPKTTARKFRITDGADNFTFYVGTQTGSVYYVNAAGSCTEVLNTDGTPLSNVLYHPTRDALVVMMEGLALGHFTVDSSGQLTETGKVKLSGRVQARTVGQQGLVWAGQSTLAILTGDLTVRIWDIDTNDNYILPTTMKVYANDDNNHPVNEIFTCIAYSKMNQTLCAGTNIGRIYFWTRKTDNESLENIEDQWELCNINTISGTVKHLMWGSVHLRLPLLCVNCITTVYIMKKQSISACFSKNIWATQKNATQALLESEKGNYMLTLELQISDMCINDSLAVFTNGKIMGVYEIIWKELSNSVKKPKEDECNFSVKFINHFNCDNEGVLLHKKTIFTISLSGVSIRSSSGTQIGTIASVTSEGEPIGMDITGHFLTICTIEGYLKIYAIDENDPKLVTSVRNMYDMCNDFGEIIQAKTNTSGNKVAFTIAAANLIPDGKLYIWDIETDHVINYDFHKYGDFEVREDVNDNHAIKNVHKNGIFDNICSSRIPLSLYWSNEDPRLLICDAKKLKMPSEKKRIGGFLKRSQSETKKELKDEEQILITTFVSSDHGIKIHDIKASDPNSKLLAISTPYIVTLKKLKLEREIMSDFIGLEDCDDTIRQAVLDFSYHLSLGNMDAAFKAIKLKSIESSGVWTSLARMCVKTRRLDVGCVCLGHMGNAAAARQLRLAISDDTLPLEAKLAVLAIHLSMLEEAAELYTSCQRQDLLVKLLISRGRMDEAHSVAESKVRVLLRNTEHRWARLLEQEGEYTEAAIRYERAHTHRAEVPRMLLDRPQRELEKYMAGNSDPELLKWWGQYAESQGDMNAALKIYSSCGDIYSQVRILCFLGEESKAAELAKSGTDKASFYHMARYYETMGNSESAVNFFSKANAYSNAVRLCKENHMKEELWNISSIAGTREKLECAKYFEETGDLEKAVILYHRAGMLHKALDLAFETQQFDTLQQIATDLDADSDPALVDKCCVYFVNNEQFDKAVDLLALAKKFTEAINICLHHNVQLTEDLAEKLTPEKDQLDEATRINVLENLAESLMQQGNYHLATKKFTQAGDKVRAMKALLKSGDTDKIIFFAGVSRQRDIYIMAANYLQSLDWQNQPEILRNIITFYSKGKALDLLANFYVACAQVETDEFQNYEKALGALTEASRCLNKISSPKNAGQHQRAVQIVQQRLDMVKRFVDVRKLFERGDEQTALAQCEQLLALPPTSLEPSVRRGDLYALMVRHWVERGRFSEARRVFLELRQSLSGGRGGAATAATPVTYYLSRDLLEQLAEGLGIPVGALLPAPVEDASEDGGVKNGEGDEEVAEEIE